MSKKEERVENKQIIYVAESSKVISKLISSKLAEQGYEVECFVNGMEILRRLTEASPNLIIADKVLPLVDGIELCKIVKDGSDRNYIPFILISAEDEVLDFWLKSTSADKAMPVSPENLDFLLDEVKRLLEFSYIEAEEFLEQVEELEEEELLEESEASEVAGTALDVNQYSVSPEDKILLWTLKAMDKSEFNFNMMNVQMSLYNYAQNMNMLVEKIMQRLYEICAYDACTLIVKSAVPRAYRNSPNEEFWEICRNDFEKYIRDKNEIHYDIRFIHNRNEEDKNVKLCSYRSFELKSGFALIGTLHIASRKKKIFSYRVLSTLDFFAKNLGYVLQESLQYENIVHSEFQLRAAFSKFVPSEVIKDILTSKKVQKEQTANNEKRKVVILMCDIRSFTTISEINQPEVVVSFLNRYFTQMVDIVTKYGGTVDKFVGDAIMVLFGAPVSYNDNAQRAVNAAIEMYERLDEVPLDQLRFPEGIKLDIGIGLHYGDVIVGNIGSKDKTNYTVIGDAVNLSSRLEGLTKLYGAKVIISGAVQEEVSEETNVLLLDTVKVKGKTQGVKIYRADSKPLPKDYAVAYEKGLKLYTEGAWNLATPYFETAHKILPQDKAAKLMLERCAEFEKNKPENWDGAIALTSK